MLPAFLQPYSAALERYRQEFIKVHAEPVNEELPIKQSKFLGKPYLPTDISYPADKKGEPMIMIAQINFSEFEAPKDYPNSGIFQLFIPSSEWYDMADFSILYHSDTDKPHHHVFDFLTEDLYQNTPIWCEHRLSFEKKVEYGAYEDFRFDFQFNGQHAYEFEETLSDSEKEIFNDLISNGGHKIGGYASFTQTDPRDYNSSKKKDVLLLQIDSDENIMWGDAGIANVFINIDKLKSKDFSSAYFNWDCC
jgi:uncharacterized protein YwqG